ncbi:MAG: ketoacyl-ACP synthase III [Nanoarchaeota archaeon]
MVNAGLISTGMYVPKEVVTNDCFECKKLYHYTLEGERGKSVLGNTGWIIKNMGVRERRYAAKEETVVDMAEQASLNALRESNFDPKDLDGIIFATLPEGRSFPSKAADLHERIRASPKCAIYDLNAACAGFTYGLALANAQIQTKEEGYWLVVASEIMSRRLYDDDVNAPIFGDGAGVALLGPTEGGGIVDTYFLTETSGKELIVDNKKNYLWMEGNPVFKQVSSQLVNIANTVLDKLKWTSSSLGLLVPHQSNIRIIENARKRLGLRENQILINIDKYGNMSAASCAIGLHEATSSGIEDGTRLLTIAAGSGIVYCSVAMQF